MTVSSRTVTSVWKRPKCSSERSEVQSVGTPQGTASPPSCHFPHPQGLMRGSAHYPTPAHSHSGPPGVSSSHSVFIRPPSLSASSP